MEYRHKQWGFLFILSYLALAAFLVASGSADSGMPTVFIVFILAMFVVSLMYSRLEVTVTRERVVAAFTYGYPRRVVELEDVTEVRRVRNTWFAGWGSRRISRGRMYNVWGFDAIELELASGRVFRIGTNDPEGLLAALTRNMGLSSHDREMVGGHSATTSRTPRENLFTSWRSVGRWLRG